MVHASVSGEHINTLSNKMIKFHSKTFQLSTHPHNVQDSAEQATNIVVIESNPAEIEEKASLDLGRRFVRPCRCRIMISKKISETKSGIDYKHKIYIHACISIIAVEMVFKT